MQDSKDKLLTDEKLHEAEHEDLLSLGLLEDEFEIKKVVVDKKLNLHLNTIIVQSKLSQSQKFFSSEEP